MGIALVTVVALVIRLWGIGNLGDLDFDEQASSFIGSMPLPEMFAYLLRQPFEHPPLFYVLFHAWLAAGGGSETAMRVFAVIPGVLAVPVLGAAVVHMAGTRAGIVAASVLALSPIHVYYSRDARMYSLLALLSVVMLAGLVWGLDGARKVPAVDAAAERDRGAAVPSGARVARDGRTPWLIVGLAGLAALSTHYYVVFLLIGLVLGLVRAVPGARGRFAPGVAALGGLPRWQLTVLGVGGAVGAAALLWVGAASGFRTSLTAVYPRPVDPGAVKAALAASLAAPLAGPLAAPAWLPYLAVVVVCLVAASLWVRGASETGLQRIALYGFLVPTIAVPLLLVLGRPFAPRYVVLATPFFAVLVGLAATRASRLWLGIGTLALLPVVGLMLAPMYGDYIRSDYGRALSALRAEARPDDVIVLNGPWQDLLFRRYGAGLPRHTFVATTVPLDPTEATAALATLVAAHPRIWVVDAATDAADPNGVVAAWLDRHAYPLPVLRYEKALLRPYLTDYGRSGVLQDHTVRQSILGLDLLSAAVDAWKLPPGGEARLRIRARWNTCVPDVDPCHPRAIAGHETRLVAQLVGPDQASAWHWDGRLWPTNTQLEYRGGIRVPETTPPGRYVLQAQVYEVSWTDQTARQVQRISDPIDLGTMEVVRPP